MSQSDARAPEARWGWVMVAVAGTFMMISVGSMSALAVFMKPLTAEMRWLRGETSFAYLTAALVLGGGGILMGHLSDRYSARPVVVAGAVVVGAAFLMLARQGGLAQFYALSALMGLGVSAFQAPLLSSVGNWFTRNKGLAIGAASAWGGLGNGVVPFAAGYLITRFGWRGAYSALGIFVLAVMVPVALLIRRPPMGAEAHEGGGAPSGAEEAGPEPGAAAPGAVTLEKGPMLDPWLATFWIGTAAVFCCTAMATPLLHVVSLAQDRGLGAQEAAGILLLISIGSFFGRIGYGRLADIIGGLRAYMVSSAMQILLVFWFTRLSSLAGFYALGLVYGLFYSGLMICLVICVREFVPIERRGVSTGVVFFCGWLGMGLGGWQAGFFFDVTGAYTVSFANSVAAGTINLLILYSLKRHIARREFHLSNAEAAA